MLITYRDQVKDEQGEMTRLLADWIREVREITK